MSDQITSETSKTRHWISWFYSLSKSERKSKRREIKDSCYISNQAFNNWLLHYSKVPHLAQEKINALAGESLDFSFSDRREKYKVVEPATPRQLYI